MFGIISPECYARLSSDDFEIRVAASEHLAQYFKSCSLRLVHISEFLKFSKPFLADANFGVVNAFSEIYKEIISKLGSQVSVYFDEFMDSMVPPLDDRRRAIRMTAGNLLVQLSSELSDFSVLERLLQEFEVQSTIRQTEILEICIRVHAHSPVPVQILPAIASALELSFLVVNSALQSVAVRLLKRISHTHSGFIDRLQPPYRSYLDADDTRLIGPLRMAGTAHTLLAKSSSPGFQKVLRTDEFWYRLRPRLAITPGSSPSIPVHISAQPLTAPPLSGPPPFAVDDTEDFAEFDRLPLPEPEERETDAPVEEPRITFNRRPRLKKRATFSGTLKSEDLQIKSLSPKSPRRYVKAAGPSLDAILLDLRSTDWEKQNETITTVLELIESTPGFFTFNISSLIFEILPLALSIRSALSKNALTCLWKLAEHFGSSFTPFFEGIVTQLLSLLSPSKKFLAALARDSISAILDRVNRRKALEFLTGDHSKHGAAARIHLALCMENMCLDCEDPGYLMKGLGAMLTDANPDVRKHARNAVMALEGKFGNLKVNVSMLLMDETEKRAIVAALSGTQ
jgi:hypothetical protein